VNERACDRCHEFFSTHLPFLKQEHRYQRYEKDGAYAVTVALAADEKSLVVKYDKGKRPPSSLSTAMLRSVEDGQTSSGWRAHTEASCGCFGAPEVTRYESLSFSLVFAAESLDLVCDGPDRHARALAAFRALLQLRSSRSAAFLDERREEVELNAAAQQQQESEERQRLIGNKYSQQRQDLKKKYGAT